jgi:hypothetical protein
VASEPLKIRLYSEGDFNGLTPMDYARADFQVRGQRFFEKVDIVGPVGQISGDFFGLFADTTPKMVGVASSSWNPMSVARVIPKDNPDVFREEIDLTPRMAYVAMYPGDKLGIVTRDGGRVTVELVVTELGEGEHVALSLRSPPEPQWRRFRIIRHDAGGFTHTPLGNAWIPNFTWDPIENMLVTSTVGNGPIPARSLCMYPKFQGCYIAVRYSGIGNDDARLYIVDGHLREAGVVQSDLKNVIWSKVQFVSHDDLVGLWTPAPAGGTVVCDIELVRVQPGDRLRGRYSVQA